MFADDSTLGGGHVFNSPESIVFDKGYQHLYVSDANRFGSGGGINIVDANTGAGTGFYPLPSSYGSMGTGESDWLAFDANANLFMTNESEAQGVMEVDPSTGDIVQPSLVSNLPSYGYALSFDKNGNLWVGDTDRILEFAPNGAPISVITNPTFSEIFAAVFNPGGDQFYAGDLTTGEVYTYALDGSLQGSFNAGAGISGLAVAGAAVPPNSTNRYVALGDSVPYGHGLDNPFPTPRIGLPWTAISQGPSSAAYPALLASDLGLTMSIRPSDCTLTGDDLAFSGADAAAVNVEKGNEQCPDLYSTGLSLQDEINAANLSSEPARLVTIQAGADDIHFADCLTYEITKYGFHVPVFTKPCVTNGAVTQKVSNELSNLRRSLAATIEEVAPHTKTVAVLNYYQIVPKPSSFSFASIFPGGKVDPVCWGLSHNLHGAYNDAVIIQRALNNTIASAVADAQAAGVTNVSLVNLANLEANHEMCTGFPALFSGEPMLKFQFYSDLALLAEAFVDPIGAENAKSDLKLHAWRPGHPNTFGQRDIARRFEATMTMSP